jgi:TetR/AcrR family transcriptional repressor of nem operon
MARPTEFAVDKAIERATRVFWHKGYAGASLRDLLKAMGIGEGSFYNAFKSKKALYLLCLRHYNDTVSRRRLAALQSGATAGAGVRAFFRAVLDELDDPKTPRVCLLAGSLSSDVLAERELKASVVAEMTAFANTFSARLQQDVASGTLPRRFAVEPVAQVLVTYLQGLFRAIRVLQTRTEVERQLDVLLQGLGL